MRIAFAVFAMDSDRALRVLEIVAGLFAHESVADAAKVDPRVREQVREKRTGIENIPAQQVFPLIGQLPCDVCGWRERKGRRAKTENVEKRRFVVSLPAIVEKPGLRASIPAKALGGRSGPSASRHGDTTRRPIHEFPARRRRQKSIRPRGRPRSAKRYRSARARIAIRACPSACRGSDSRSLCTRSHRTHRSECFARKI